MFSTNFMGSSSPSLVTQTIDVARNKSALLKRNSVFTQYQTMVNNVACKMVRDLDQLKNIIIISATAYHQHVEHKFFRGQGRKRASVLIDKVNESNNVDAVLSALEMAIQSGNENDDSLKVYLFKGIKQGFSEKDDINLYLSFGQSISTFLMRLINEAYAHTDRAEPRVTKGQ